MKARTFSLILMAATLSSCEFHCSVGDTENSSKTTKDSNSATIPANKTETKNSTIIKNNIDLEAINIKVNKTYLTDEQNKNLDSNVIDLGKKIICMVELDTGWVKINGKSFIGASEKITTQDGSVVLASVDDIFKDSEITGIPADQAKYVWLNAVVTKKHENINNYNVEFRIWDKKGTGVINGKYNFKLK